MAQSVTGTTSGLKAEQRDALERIFRRSVPPDEVITTELAHFMAQLSREMRRQVGVLIDRRGRIQHVLIGDGHKLVLPDLGRHRAGKSRLRGIRLVHTHVFNEGLSRDDLTDLSLLQLDLMGVIQVSESGQATTFEYAHLVPPGPTDQLWTIVDPEPLGEMEFGFQLFIDALEEEFARRQPVSTTDEGFTKAIAVHVSTGAHGEPDTESSLAELRELARTAQVDIVETVIQRRQQLHPKYVLGRGRLEDLVLASMQQQAELIVFDRDLTPAQARSIADTTEAKVIDRTQLILDIFAQRATTRDGKLQVELAQLKYTLPRLAGRNTAMSRLAGGIGGRGPGETKLEIDRRRAQARIHHLTKQIDKLSRQRFERRRRRRDSRIPIVAIVGYTNAGKSTLLNRMTGADVLAEDKLFATLDPTTRRLRVPDEREVVFTDTVGFIRDLPQDLVAAFKATLEELSEAHVLLHVVDIATPGWEQRITSVDRILEDLGVEKTPTVIAFNKIDQVEDLTLLQTLCRSYNAVAISALDKTTIAPLVARIVEVLPHNVHRP